MRQEGRSSVRLRLENDQKSTLRVASLFALGSGGDGNMQPVCAGQGSRKWSVRLRRGHGERKESVRPCCEHKKTKAGSLLTPWSGSAETTSPSVPRSGGWKLSVCLCCGQSEWQRSICPRWVQVERKRPARLRCGQGRTETVSPSVPGSRGENALLTGAARERRCDAAMNREAAACRPIRRAT